MRLLISKSSNHPWIYLYPCLAKQEINGHSPVNATDEHLLLSLCGQCVWWSVIRLWRLHKNSPFMNWWIIDCWAMCWLSDCTYRALISITPNTNALFHASHTRFFIRFRICFEAVVSACLPAFWKCESDDVRCEWKIKIVDFKIQL